MAVPNELKGLVGRWRGTNQLWLAPGEPVRVSESEAELTIVSKGQFAELRYTWSEENQLQEGRLIVGQGADPNHLRAVWFDTWHMRDDFMVLTGAREGGRGVSLSGSYAAPPDPDWGWQISFELLGEDAFRFVMYNITPQGEKMLAVEVTYSRRG